MYFSLMKLNHKSFSLSLSLLPLYSLLSSPLSLLSLFLSISLSLSLLSLLSLYLSCIAFIVPQMSHLKVTRGSDLAPEQTSCLTLSAWSWHLSFQGWVHELRETSWSILTACVSYVCVIKCSKSVHYTPANESVTPSWDWFLQDSCLQHHHAGGSCQWLQYITLFGWSHHGFVSFY